MPEETGKASPGPKTSRARNRRTRGTDGVFLISDSNWRQRPWKRREHMGTEQLAQNLITEQDLIFWTVAGAGFLGLILTVFSSGSVQDLTV